MKQLTLLLSILVLAAATAVAQPKKSITAPNDTIMGVYLNKDVNRLQTTTLDFFAAKDIFESNFGSTVADVIFEGRTDTSTATAVYYGRPWLTNRLSKMPRVWFSGRDSGTILVKYRFIALGNDGIYSAGPWLIYGGLITSTAQRAGRDSLIQVDPASTAMADSMLVNHSPGIIQFRYQMTSTRAAAAGGGTKQFNRDAALNKNYSPVGQMILNGRRAEGR